MSCSDICLALVAVIFPPIAVWIKRGICSLDSLLNICLSCLGFVPGLIHAWYVIARYPDDDDDEGAAGYASAGPYQRLDDAEAGRVTYYYVSHDAMAAAPPQAQQPGQQTPPQPQGAQGAPLQRPPTGGPQLSPQAAAAVPTGAPDGGRAHREIQRGTSYGSMRRGASEQRNNGGEGAARAPPPSYTEAVQGDHKVQT